MNKYIFQSGKLLLSIVMITMMILLAAACSPTYAPAPTSSTPPATTTSSPTTSSTSTSSSPTASATGATINVASNPTLGNILVDSKGMTLYYFTKDIIGKSNATGTILAAWPIFNAATINVQGSLAASDFAIITRDDGQQQTTYKGLPLYYYAKDKAPGDVLGDKVGGVWFVVKSPFYTLMLQNKADPGTYLVDAKGMTLYYFTKDNIGKSTATGTILANWPVFNADSFVVPSALSASDFGTITRDDGLKVSTYKGWPLYHYAKDQVSGDTLGQGIGGIWFVINPSNFPPTPVSSPSPSLSPSPSPSISATPSSGGTGY